MKIGSISYRLFLRQSISEEKDLYTIYCKLIQGNEIKVISTGIRVPKEAWVAKKYSIKHAFNTECYLLEAWKIKLHKKLLDAYSTNQNNTIIDIVIFMNPTKSAYEANRTKGFLEVFRMFTAKAKQLIGKEYNRATVYKFDSTITAFSAFLLHHYQKNDIILDKVRLKHLLEYEEYAAMVLKHKTATINKTIQRLKQIIKYAIGHDYLDKDPWTMHKSKSVQHLIVYLSKEQLDLLLHARMSLLTLEKVKDCFVFSCFTGLAYAEIAAISKENIILKNNIPWICMQRQKTKKSFLIPMLPPAFTIWKKYEGVLPVFTNQRYNLYLKEIMQELRINIHLTTHVARKTFTSTVLLGNNIPLKVASTLLGHSDSKITEKYYAEVSNDLLEQHAEALFNIFKK